MSDLNDSQDVVGQPTPPRPDDSNRPTLPRSSWQAIPLRIVGLAILVVGSIVAGIGLLAVVWTLSTGRDVESGFFGGLVFLCAGGLLASAGWGLGWRLPRRLRGKSSV